MAPVLLLVYVQLRQISVTLIVDVRISEAPEVNKAAVKPDVTISHFD